MKLLTAEEIEANRYHTLMGGLQGLGAGLLISAVGFKYGPKKFPKFKPSAWPWSMKTALFITPPTLLSAICAEEASNKFDEITYGSGKESKEYLEDQVRWQKLSFKEKCLEGFSNNRYKIITGAWALSMWGSWELVNRDKIMSSAQKAVQARMYAQFITVALLLGSMMLSMYENKLHPNQRQLNEKRRWEKALQQAEIDQQLHEEGTEIVRKTGFVSNQDRKNAKIFKYD
ncbi:hypothetical protein Kpol_1028p60 [Vanderwaltozyma polyspora DSM 70294]|uniref:HIG1 domain-containing protein n=1 Tax=Vanderwaltozyma polyspora (strain ATCC 22028 / DSM 70294 / BCRC 21397 / CBS 2163 / NBRC 10782 / NRRL Y-8283 / UCD 57-17) TaxID=436907 RepID=A7TG28_VANPO|nr:uncharacterized protein Kpol_1028p60 [Vanderwaltozyma polyspora DSM 70294]EDO18785.1 hypothetical protein Kpol_1028p60 [Vanderwaltozyma polyspora DSM 70294]